MAVEPLILACNPGSSSRKYALYEGKNCLAKLYFEHEDQNIVYTLWSNKGFIKDKTEIKSLKNAIKLVNEILIKNQVITGNKNILAAGLRIVAPSGYFLTDKLCDQKTIDQLKSIEDRAPLHISTALEEIEYIQQTYAGIKIIAISDSAFHATKPDYAWNYGLPVKDSDRIEIKRFGYHGLSAASTVKKLHRLEKLPRKLIICHLGSGASVSAIFAGKSIDNSMGYSPLEGLIMSTRVGNIDPTAVAILKKELKMSWHEIEQYLNNESGLKGLSNKSGDIRELLKSESSDQGVKLALNTYIFNVRKTISQMTGSLQGIDGLAFTGTVAERASVIREKIVSGLGYLDLALDKNKNKHGLGDEDVVLISKPAHSKPIFIVRIDETAEMVSRILKSSLLN